MSYRERYEEYLKSEQWANKREEKAKEQNYTCEKCGKVILKGFHIHHKTYKHFMKEPMKDLQFLCEDCHIDAHCKINARKEAIKKKKAIKCCNNCYYSQIMNYSGLKTRKKVLWCNKKCKSCEDVDLCKGYRKGSTKPKIKTKEDKTKKRKQVKLTNIKINFKCKYCKNTGYIIKKHKVNVGIYCSMCKKWSKFISKTEQDKIGIR